MANFFCSKCNAMVSASRVDGGICKKCGNKKPFVCAKCEKAMGLNDIFNLSDVTISNQPIYCEECGSERELIKCAICGVKLIRATGVERVVDNEKKICHQKCLDKNAKMFKIMLPVLSLLFSILLGYLSYKVDVWRYDSAIESVNQKISELSKEYDEKLKNIKGTSAKAYDDYKLERKKVMGEKNEELQILEENYKSGVMYYVLGGMFLGVVIGVGTTYKLFKLR
ncbi:hypothetical protein IJT10_02080 [bacterium]|nr:hypothetical protein [bacterium]